MIACISSTLRPSGLPSHDGERSTIPPDTRLLQTVESIGSLVSLGFSEIHLADNSPSPLEPEIIALLAPAKVYHFSHYPYRNKGIGESHLLLELCARIPKGKPVMKLSGRYTASINLCAQLGDASFAGLFTHWGSRNMTMSTRAYAVLNSELWRQFISGSLNEMYASPLRITGPRSLLGALRRRLRPKDDSYPYFDPRSGLEKCAAKWLQRQGLPVKRLEQLGVEGIMGGWINPTVSE